MQVSPNMRELRWMLRERGILFIEDDFDGVVDEWSGFYQHVERTLVGDAIVLYAWTRDGDNTKQWQSDGGRAGYLEVDVGDQRMTCDVDEALDVLLQSITWP